MWIHILDLVSIIKFIIDNNDISGPVNLCSPNPVKNNELAKAIGKSIHRPSWLPVPGFMLKILLGEFGTMLLNGQRVIPARLMEKGYSFQFPSVNEALDDILK